MKIVVIGGHGRIGSKIVAKLGEHGHDAVAAGPKTGVNTITGEGLAEALAGADVVIDVSNSPSFEDDAVMDFFRTSTGNLLAAEQAAGVGHHVAMSVVGSDRLPDSGYLRAKVAQEQLIEASSIPYSIVRSTQFYEFVESIAAPPPRATPFACRRRASSPSRPTTPPAPWAGSPWARPWDGIVEVAGPQPYRFDELIRKSLSARNDPRHVVVDPDARYFGTKLANGSLLPGEHAQLGETRFEDWLGAHATAG